MENFSPTKAAHPPWLTNARAGWDVDVHTWLLEIGEQRNLGVINSFKVIKERPWSIVLQVHFTKDTAYFKACGVGGKFEPQLLQHLVHNQHLLLPDLYAIEVQRSWLLMADAGVLLQEFGAITQQLAILKQLLSGYARLQIDSLADIESYLELGLPDRRVEKLPRLLESLLGDERLAVERSVQEVNKLQTSVQKLLPHFERTCFELAASSYGAALDHGDIHRGNIFVNNGDPCLSDWGDACVTHPFCSAMLIIETTLTQVPEDKRVSWIRPLLDTYLAPWQIFAPREQLLPTFQTALWAAYAVRVLNMAHMFQHAPAQHMVRWLPYIAQYLEKWVWYADFLERDIEDWMETSNY
ncbi:MAG: phosphotransferase [Anaerolineales bacterium]|nr:phosphotransferase [Anaerolineales bacterium]